MEIKKIRRKSGDTELSQKNELNMESKNTASEFSSASVWALLAFSEYTNPDRPKNEKWFFK